MRLVIFHEKLLELFVIEKLLIYFYFNFIKFNV